MAAIVFGTKIAPRLQLSIGIMILAMSQLSLGIILIAMSQLSIGITISPRLQFSKNWDNNRIRAAIVYSANISTLAAIVY